MIDQARFCLLIYKIDNFREHRLRRVKQFRMLACATFVPIAKGFPFCSIFSPAKHVAFARENEIGPHRKREIGETGLKQVDGAAGVDREEHAIVLQIAEKELFLKDQIQKAENAGNFEEIEKLEKQLTSEIARLRQDCEAKKEKLRASFAK